MNTYQILNLGLVVVSSLQLLGESSSSAEISSVKITLCVVYIGTRARDVSVQYFNKISYHPPTKLREGNVFTGVCLSVHRKGGPHVTITHAASSDMGTPWCLFKLVHWTSLYNPPDIPTTGTDS